MPIQEVPAYRVGERVFPTIEEAQKAGIVALFEPWTQSASDSHAVAAAAAVVAHTDEIVAILTCITKPKWPRKLRSDIGKKRDPKIVPEPEA